MLQKYHAELIPIINYFSLIQSDLCISDEQGRIAFVSDGYCIRHGVEKEKLIGASPSEIEKQNLFYPSITKICLEKKKKITIAQTNPKGDVVLSTATPALDKNNNIKYILCYNALDIADCSYAPLKFDKVVKILNDYLNTSSTKHLHCPATLNSRSKKMADILQTIDQIANTDVNILITGETGVGKSLIAKYIHEKNTYSTGDFIEINCASIPPTLVESELFGYEPGSFTGANVKGKKGKIELAHKGTLFLDEISEMTLEMQSKFLHAIQNKKISHVGGNTFFDIDFRLISATNKSLSDEISKGLFREDLYYRINVIPLHIPALRERKEDILPLSLHFLNKYNKKYKKEITFSFESMKALELHDWPGNVRQLQNYIERLVVLSDSAIVTANMISMDITNNSLINTPSNNMSLSALLDNYEASIIKDAYKKYKTSIKVAEHLQIGQTTAARKIKKYILKE